MFRIHALALVAGLAGSASVMADGIINGDFEDTGSIHREWEVQKCDESPASATVVLSGGNPSSFARITGFPLNSAERTTLSQDGLEFCGELGAYATIQFDVRNNADIYNAMRVRFGGVRVIPYTDNLWQTHRVSVPIGSAPTEVDFTAQNFAFPACGTYFNLQLDIDNVICFVSAEDLTTLCGEPVACLVSTCLGGTESGPLTGVGGGAAPIHETCKGDLNGDCVVGFDDLVIVQSNWGPCDSECVGCCRGDTNGDCVVDFDDLLNVLNGWGDCTNAPCTDGGCDP